MGVVALAILALAASMPTSVAWAQQPPVRIIAFGDSLTAGYRLPPEAAFPVRLARRLAARGANVQIVNAGVSGDTTATGLERIDWATGEPADAVILELGANDALRGIDPQVTRANLEKIIDHLKAKGLAILLVGMKAPRGLGETYTSAFDSIFPDLAKEHDLILYPFFLDGIALDPRLNLDDGMHPNALGVDVIVDRITPYVERLIDRVKARRQSSK